jgi:hypothetical protein
VPYTAQGDWLKKDKKLFNRLMINREGELEVIHTCKTWPISFGMLWLKLHQNTELSSVIKVLIENKVARIEQYPKVLEHFSSIKPLFDTLTAMSVYSGVIDNRPDLNNTIAANNHLNVTLNSSSSRQNSLCNQSLNKLTKEPKKPQPPIPPPPPRPPIHIFMLDQLAENVIQLDEKSSFQFELINPINPSNFYVKLASNAQDKHLTLQKEIQAVYLPRERDLALLSVKQKYDFVKVNGLCVARVSIQNDNVFVRGLITSMGSDDNDDKNDQDQVSVFALDFGHVYTLKRSCLYPIVKRAFLTMPAHVIKCKLGQIKCKSVSANDGYDDDDYNDDDDGDANGWSEEARSVFESWLVVGVSYQAKAYKFVPEEELRFRPSICLSIVVESILSGNKDNLSLNAELIHRGHAKFRKETDDELFDSMSVDKLREYDTNANNNNETESPIQILPMQEYAQEYRMANLMYRFITDCDNELKRKEPKPIESTQVTTTTIELPKREPKQLKVYEAIDELEAYNPLKDDYNSPANVYDCDVENLEQILFGKATKEDTATCKIFLKYGKCNKDPCAFLHRLPQEGILSGLWHF